MTDSPIYTTLAPLYDHLMADVDYDAWADYIDEILQIHHPFAENVLELACGTGTLALSLEEFGYYRITGTDMSPEMIKIAQQKASRNNSEVHFRTMNFLDIDIGQTFDAIYSVFDSVNYLHQPEQILAMLNQCARILNPRGLLIFDFSTPINSAEAAEYLNNIEATTGGYRYYRTSRYDYREKFHYNEFEIQQLAEDGRTVVQTFREQHSQRIYSLDEILEILKQTPYHLEAKYGDFDLIDADHTSARVTIVLRCLKTQ